MSTLSRETLGKIGSLWEQCGKRLVFRPREGVRFDVRQDGILRGATRHQRRLPTGAQLHKLPHIGIRSPANYRDASEG